MTRLTKPENPPQAERPEETSTFIVPQPIRGNDQLPAAVAEVLVSSQERKFSLELIYVRIANAERKGVVRQAFDDGAAIVDRNRHGVIVGIEFTSIPKREELPEYLDGRDDPDALLLWCALCTSRNVWFVYERVLAALNRYHLALPPERTGRAIFDLASASPDHDLWRRPAQAGASRGDSSGMVCAH